MLDLGGCRFTDQRIVDDWQAVSTLQAAFLKNTFCAISLPLIKNSITSYAYHMHLFACEVISRQVNIDCAAIAGFGNDGYLFTWF